MKILRKYKIIEDLLRAKKSIFIFGPRGTGKTHFVNHLLQKLDNSITINLLLTDVYKKYLTEPSRLRTEIEYELKNRETCLHIFIDEIQLVPNLLNEVHHLIEKHKGTLIFILSGSSARKLKRENANLLAGRAIKVDFHSLSFLEINPTQYLDKLLQYGNLPEVITENQVDIIEQYLRTYVGTYLSEEIKKEANIRNLEAFSNFLELVAIENSKLVNFTKISKIIGISDSTIREYYQILTDTLIAHRIPAWKYSIRKQIVNSPRYYLFDNGIINTLSGHLRTELKSATYRYGSLFENLIVNEFIKQNSFRGEPVKLYHYRTYEDQEIDLILQKNSTSPPIAVEIKSAIEVKTEKLQAILNFKKDYPNARTFVITSSETSYTKDGLEFLGYRDGVSKILDAAT